MAQVNNKTRPQISNALHSQLQILSHFTRIPSSHGYIIRIFSLRLYTEMLTLELNMAKQSEFNSVKFLQACSLLLKLIKQLGFTNGSTGNQDQNVPISFSMEPLRQIEQFIEVNLLGN